MIRLTIETASALRDADGDAPCWSEERIAEYLDGRPWCAAKTVLLDTSEAISRSDQRWLVEALLLASGGKVLVDQWVAMLVERAIRRSLGKSGCDEWEAWALRWISGKDRSLASAAAVADAGGAAAWAAASAKMETSAAAASAAAVAAVVAKMVAATASAEHRQQMLDALSLLEEPHNA